MIKTFFAKKINFLVYLFDVQKTQKVQCMRYKKSIFFLLCLLSLNTLSALKKDDLSPDLQKLLNQPTTPDCPCCLPNIDENDPHYKNVTPQLVFNSSAEGYATEVAWIPPFIQMRAEEIYSLFQAVEMGP